MSFDGLVFYLLTIVSLYVCRWPCIISIDYCFTAMSFDGVVFYLLNIVSLLCLSMAFYSIY